MLNKPSTEFAIRFEQIKQAFGLKNTDLAELGEVTPHSISKVVAGHTDTPNLRTLINIGRKLNLNADWLLYGRDPMMKPPVSTDPETMIRLGSMDGYVADLLAELNLYRSQAATTPRNDKPQKDWDALPDDGLGSKFLPLGNAASAKNQPNGKQYFTLTDH